MKAIRLRTKPADSPFLHLPTPSRFLDESNRASRNSLLRRSNHPAKASSGVSVQDNKSTSVATKNIAQRVAFS